MSQDSRDPRYVTSRRRVLRGLLIGLGAGVLVQPHAGIAQTDTNTEGKKKGKKKKKGTDTEAPKER